MAAGLTREQRGHAVVPAAQAASALFAQAFALVGDGEAVAGGAKVGAGPAGEAAVGLVLPELRVVEAGSHLFGCALDVGGRHKAGPGLLARRLCLGEHVGPFGKRRIGQQFLALGRDGLQHIAALDLGHEHVRAFGRGGAAANPVAEAGIAAAAAGERNHRKLFAPGLVVRIGVRALEVGAVEHGIAACVAGAAGKNHGGLGLGLVVQAHGDALEVVRVLGFFVAHQGFALGQHGLLGGYGGLCHGKGLAFLPGLKDHRALVGGFFYRHKHAAAILREVGEKRGQAVGCYKADCAHFQSLS